MKGRPSKISVEPEASGRWTLQGGGRSEVFATQAEAIDAARNAVRHQGGEVVIRKANGRLSKSFTLGRSAMEKLNAVEGLTLPSGVSEAFVRFDSNSVSPDQRRSELSSPYRKSKR